MTNCYDIYMKWLVRDYDPRVTQNLLQFKLKDLSLKVGYR